MFECPPTGEGTRSMRRFLESAFTIKQLPISGNHLLYSPGSVCEAVATTITFCKGEDYHWGLTMTQKPWQTGCFRGFRLKSKFRGPDGLGSELGAELFRLVRPEVLPRQEHEMSKLKRCLFTCPYLTSRQSEPDISLTRISNRALAGLPLGFWQFLDDPW